MKAGEVYRDPREDRAYLVTAVFEWTLFVVIVRYSEEDIRHHFLAPRNRECWLDLNDAMRNFKRIA